MENLFAEVNGTSGSESYFYHIIAITEVRKKVISNKTPFPSVMVNGFQSAVISVTFHFILLSTLRFKDA